MLQTMQQIGASLGVAVMVAVAASHGRSLLGGMTNAFTVSAGIAVVDLRGRLSFRPLPATNGCRSRCLGGTVLI